LRTLLQSGYDPNTKFDETNCEGILYAAALGHIDVYKLLKDSGANVDVKDGKNRDCLSLAFSYEQDEMTKYLMNNSDIVYLDNNLKNFVKSDRFLKEFTVEQQQHFVKFALEQINMKAIDTLQLLRKNPIHKDDGKFVSFEHSWNTANEPKSLSKPWNEIPKFEFHDLQSLLSTSFDQNDPIMLAMCLQEIQARYKNRISELKLSVYESVRPSDFSQVILHALIIHWINTSEMEKSLSTSLADFYSFRANFLQYDFVERFLKEKRNLDNDWNPLNIFIQKCAFGWRDDVTNLKEALSQLHRLSIPTYHDYKKPRLYNINTSYAPCVEFAKYIKYIQKSSQTTFGASQTTVLGSGPRGIR
jgi:hypothetical protein